jgi:hypothetical protein
MLLWKVHLTISVHRTRTVVFVHKTKESCERRVLSLVIPRVRGR